MTELNQTRALHTTLHSNRDLSFIWTDGPVTVLLGDVRTRLAELDAESVQCVVTSPPYWGLRDYKVAGQLGLERDPDEYLAAMVAVFDAVGRVLRADGTLWLNLGDSYAAAASGRTHPNDGERPEMDGNFRVPSLESREERWKPRQHVGRAPSGYKPKDLIGIPWQLALALRAAGWYLRSDIIWSKPNPMPESVQDRPTKAHEYLFLLTRSERYYYDADAIRTPLTAKTLTTFGSVRNDPGDGSGLVKSENFGRDVPVRQPRMKMPDGWDTGAGGHGSFHRDGREKGETKDKQRGHGRRHAGFNDRWDQMSRDEQQYAGANARTVWEIATQAYPEAHFATFPEALVEPCVLAGSRQGDVVLDPFAGSGTTLAVARRLGRRAIGIELQPDYLPLIQRRVREAALPLVEVMDGLPEQSFSTLNEV